MSTNNIRQKRKASTSLPAEPHLKSVIGEYKQQKKTASEEPTLLYDAFEKDIRPFIDTIDDLRRYGLEKDVSLPSVVVVGDQSSGKSSILEAISGVQLPRGKGIVTRCPLEMQLNHVTSTWKCRLSYENTCVDISTPAEVEEAIRKAQNTLAGDTVGISNSLITLRIESPSAPDLTLIDLPGITRTAVEGQPADIGKQIRALINNYVKQKNSIILCVIAANIDIAVNEAIPLAQEADPDGIRTLGVLTKPDLVVENCTKQDVLDLLDNKRVKLKKGFRMVKLRSLDELNRNMTLEEAMKIEKFFFETDEVYRRGNPRHMGITNLSNRLTAQLVELIRETIPELKAEVRRQHEETRTQLEKVPSGPPTEKAQKLGFLFKVMSEFNSRVEKCMKEGEITRVKQNGRERQNTFGTWRRYFEEFHAFLKNTTEKELSGHSGELSVRIIQERLAQERGRELPRFVNYDLFETLIREHLKNYVQPAEDTLKIMCTDLTLTMRAHVNYFFQNFPEIKADIQEICAQVQEKLEAEARSFIQLCFQEEALVYTQDAHFNLRLESFEKRMQEAKRLNPQLEVAEKAMSEVEKSGRLMHDLVRCYTEVSNFRIADRIPSCLRLSLHHNYMELLKIRTHDYITRDGTVDKVREPDDVTDKRCQLEEKEKRLHKAMMKLSRF